MYDMLIVYDLNTYREEFRIKFASRITCITPSRDSRTVLISVAEGEVQMIDIENRYVIRKFKGLHQGTNIIRNCFGGAAENFVLSGSRGESHRTALSSNIQTNFWQRVAFTSGIRRIRRLLKRFEDTVRVQRTKFVSLVFPGIRKTLACSHLEEMTEGC